MNANPDGDDYLNIEWVKPPLRNNLVYTVETSRGDSIQSWQADAAFMTRRVEWNQSTVTKERKPQPISGSHAGFIRIKVTQTP